MTDGESDEAMAGVGDKRHAGITDEGDSGALLHSEDEFGSASEFVVLLVADQGLVNLEMIEELQGVTGVFTSNLVSFLKNTERAESDVLEIADGSSDEVEAAAGGSLGSIRMRVGRHGTATERV